MNNSNRKMCSGDSMEMREMAARICRDYLHGAWKSVTPQNIGFKHISGGLSNWLYQVWLPDNNNAPSQQQQQTKPLANDSGGGDGGGPKEVLIRIYGQTHGRDDRALEALITESVIFTLLSERGLGPRLHGVFPGGRIEEYIAARPLYTHELSDPKLSAQIARKMAAVHQMEVPLSKEPRWLWDTMHRWHMICHKKLSDTRHVIVPEHCLWLCTVDFEAEVRWLRQLVNLRPSPVVFCHNDFQEGNILLRQNNGQEEKEEEEEDQKFNHVEEEDHCDLVLIDFEYCSYNYRGFDIANHLIEWMYDYTEPNAPYYSERAENYPNEMQRLHFIRNYQAVSEELSCSDTQLLAEIETYSLASHLFWGLWSLVNAGQSQITFGYWEYAASRLGAYKRLKEELLLLSSTKLMDH